jgi:hypothetical protein
MAENVKSLELADPVVDHIARRIHQIVYAPARTAADMVVVVGNPVVPGFVLARVQLLDGSGPSQKVQIPVHGAKTDVGQTFAHDLVQGCSGWM